MDEKILDNISSPEDLKALAPRQLTALCSELRETIIDTVSKNGGHLAPNLGVVELTVALHSVFNMPEDKIVWDVGHQSYVHKLLTGRRDRFHSIRTDNGLSGFTLREESEFDCFSSGHAGTAISAAMGFAAARDARNGSEHVIAVVGDGSLICGLSLEALNNVRSSCRNLIIIVNDNKMSISKSVGAIPNYLNRIITGRSYNHFKAFAKMAVQRMPSGSDIIGGIQKLEEATKSLFVPGVFFEEMGLRYVGPINGHKLPELIETFNRVKDFNRPVIVHVITEKGAGCEYAKEAPEKFHGVSSFNPHTGHSEHASSGINFSAAFGASMIELAEKDPEVVAITAAMRSGTGLLKFSEQFPDRFFDVGIAEEHGLTFAGGLAAGGMRPVVALYATFLQRGLDCVFHDICLQNLPVIICADRAGIVEDGPTHHGIYDESFLLSMPRLSVLAPKNETELKAMLFAAYEQKTPVAIRYPRGGENARLAQYGCSGQDYDFLHRTEGAQAVLISYADEMDDILTACEKLTEHRINCDALKLVKLFPFTEKMIEAVKDYKIVLFAEECVEWGSIGEHLAYCLQQAGWNGTFLHAAVHTANLPHATVPQIKQVTGLDADTLAQQVMDAWMKGENVL